MKFHSFHESTCPEARGDAGKILNTLAMFVGVVAPLNALPQIFVIFQNKSTASVSLLTYLIVFITQLVWLVYGVKLSLMPLIISSIVVLLLSGIIMFQFALYG